MTGIPAVTLRFPCLGDQYSYNSPNIICLLKVVTACAPVLLVHLVHSFHQVSRGRDEECTSAGLLHLILYSNEALKQFRYRRPKLPDIFQTSKEEVAVVPFVTDPTCANSTTRQNPPICNPTFFLPIMRLKCLDIGHTIIW